MKYPAKSSTARAVVRATKVRNPTKRSTSRSLTDFCRSLTQVTEYLKCGTDLVFSIGNKMFAVFDSRDLKKFSFKTTPDKFAVLTTTDGLIPAPYAARFHWVAVVRADVLPDGVARQLIGESYELVAVGLPVKVRK